MSARRHSLPILLAIPRRIPPQQLATLPDLFRNHAARIMHRCKPPGSPAQPACIAVPIRPLSPVQSSDYRPVHARCSSPYPSPRPVATKSARHPWSTQIPRSSAPHEYPSWHAAPLRCFTSCHSAPHVQRAENSFSRHPKRNRAIAPVRPGLPDAAAARTAAPQIPRGSHGPPRSRGHRSPTNILPGTPPSLCWRIRSTSPRVSASQ